MITLLFILNNTFQAKKFDSRDAAYDWAFEQEEQVTLVKTVPFREPSVNTNKALVAYHLLDTHGYRGTVAMTPLHAAGHLRRNPQHQLAPMPA